MDLEGWEFAQSSREAYVLKELRKLKMPKHAAAKLELGMQRIAAGTARRGEYTKVRGAIYELRADYDGCWYRLLFARKRDKYVALTLVQKKRNDLDNAWIENAEQRLRDH